MLLIYLCVSLGVDEYILLLLIKKIISHLLDLWSHKHFES